MDSSAIPSRISETLYDCEPWEPDGQRKSGRAERERAPEVCAQLTGLKISRKLDSPPGKYCNYANSFGSVMWLVYCRTRLSSARFYSLPLLLLLPSRFHWSNQLYLLLINISQGLRFFFVSSSTLALSFYSVSLGSTREVDPLRKSYGQQFSLARVFPVYGGGGMWLHSKRGSEVMKWLLRCCALTHFGRFRSSDSLEFCRVDWEESMIVYRHEKDGFNS